ncbi:MAG TPA: hypothetical protein DDY68_02375, partial [Porphyromonadaceae bacterium]|nr:hypothetical protein [Porphyromonadaceae bacterium]
LEDLYLYGKCADRTCRFQYEVVKKYKKRIDMLLSATCKEDLFHFKSLDFEPLHGDKEGLYSIKLDILYRLELKLNEQNTDSLLTLCTLERIIKSRLNKTLWLNR